MHCGDERTSLGEIVEMAQSQPTRRAFRQQALEALQRHLGFQGAMMDKLDPSLQLTNCGFIGLDFRFIETARKGWAACYQAEVSPLFTVAERAGGVVVDSQVFGSRDREQRRYYADVMDPLQFGHTLWAHLRIRGRVVGNVAFARPKGSRPFDEEQVMLVRALAPMLALADGSFEAPERPPVAEVLSAREREVASLVGLGYTNREIATALGTSANTVRNQLVTVFKKAEVTTRAELAGLFGRADGAR